MSNVSFAELKQHISIEKVAVDFLGLKLFAGRGEQLRGRCPIHNGTDDRGFVITPSKGLFYCFKPGCGGGDAIALVAKVKGIPLRDAALEIQRAFGLGTGNSSGTVNSTGRPPTAPQNQKAGDNRPSFDPDAYAARLKLDHEALETLGISEATCKAWKAGIAVSGVLRGRLALPVADGQGDVIGYIGRALSTEQQPRLQIPSSVDPHLIFGADRVTEGDLFLVRDPLEVLKAFENGIENVVAFLSEGITAQQLEALASLMDERKVETISFF